MLSKVKKISIQSEQFFPYVLKCSFFSQGMNYAKGLELDKRYVYDYELEFFTESQGSMRIEEEVYPIKKGDIVFRRPGQLAQGILPYSCYLICFDLLSNTQKNRERYNFEDDQEFQQYYMNPILDMIPCVFSPLEPEKYRDLFDKVLQEFMNLSEGSDIMLKSLLLNIIYQIYMDIKSCQRIGNEVNLAQQKIVWSAQEYIKKNYFNKIALKDLADFVCLSPAHFHKIFTRYVKKTPNTFVTEVRLFHAKELLVKTDLPIYEVACKCGFESNIPYFTYMFTKHIGTSPLNFRKRYDYLEK